MASIDIIQGAQWGSEGKGMVAGALALRERYDFAVRTGAINAGHTVYYKGKPYVMQQLPVAWVNPNTKLVIGPGAYVHLPTLMREIDMVAEATGEDVGERLFIDRRVGVHRDSYSKESSDAHRHQKIGATGKGCAEAIVHKIRDRGDDPLLLLFNCEPGPILWNWCDAPELLTKSYDKGARIMLEGTQGELLDFHLGPWPYVTSRQTTPAAWVAEAGLSPSLQYNIILVARSYPIRVAGNSGYMPLETAWPALARSIRTELDLHGMGADHPLWVSEESLVAFENAVEAWGDWFEEPGFGGQLRRHYVQTQRWHEMHKEALSIYAGRAMDALPDSTRNDLRKLFEFTTVTKKLRRVAHMDFGGLGDTVYRLQPSVVVMTFLNYKFPHLHGVSGPLKLDRNIVDWLPGGISAVTTGPGPEHFHWI